MSEWIPVSERLPERCKEVIVTDIETSDTYLSRYIGNRYWECDNGLFKDRIIAWMPLPEPYREVSEMKDYVVLDELIPKTQELHRAIFDKGYEQGQKDILEQEPCEDCISRQGKWIYKTMKGQFCSICDEQSIWKFNYCPNCGAKMVEP